VPSKTPLLAQPEDSEKITAKDQQTANQPNPSIDAILAMTTTTEQMISLASDVSLDVKHALEHLIALFAKPDITL
jgi:hypothetical protein